MKLSVISFTRSGCRINERLVRNFREKGEICTGYAAERFLSACEDRQEVVPLKASLGEWTKEQFEQCDGIFFVGAAGIAVRAIAPYVKDKMTDPAVVVVDDQGRFAVSLLSGHVGGGNQLAGTAAEILGAMPVITTATDRKGQFAVDVAAVENGCWISDRTAAKEVSSDVLDGVPVGFFCDLPMDGRIPDGLVQNVVCKETIWITWRSRVEKKPSLSQLLPSEAEGKVLRLVPKVLSVGVGCRRGTDESVIEAAIRQVFEEYGLEWRAIAGVASLDLKKDEAGLLAFCRKWDLEFSVCDAGTLETLPGSFSESEFVKKVTGTGTVCERAAVWDAMRYSSGKEARLLVGKQSLGGVTVAVALRNKTITMREPAGRG